MGTKRAIYWKAGNKVHFETDDKAVKIIDDNNNEIGTLKQLAFEGKPVSNISYRDIKRTGIYMVHGFKDRDLPTGVPNDKNCILSVTAVGADPNNPDVIFYKIITPAGKTIENTVSGSVQSGWGEGGIDLRNTINTINNSIGRASDLGGVTIAQYAKDNRNKITSLDSRENSHYQEFKNHNHDDRYVRKTGDAINGGITFGSSGKTASIGFDETGKFVIGGNTQQTEIKGKGSLLYNGQSVLTSSSYIDADAVGGHSASDFIIDGGLSGDGIKLSGEAAISAYNRTGKLYFGEDGTVNLRNGQSGLELYNSGFALYGNGVTLSHNGVVDWHGVTVMKWDTTSADPGVSFEYAPLITGARLFIGQDPAGWIPDGSVWIGN